VNVHDSELSPLNQLVRACAEATTAGRELLELQRELDLLGLQIGSTDRALAAIGWTIDCVHAARNLLLYLPPEMRSGECA